MIINLPKKQAKLILYAAGCFEDDTRLALQKGYKDTPVGSRAAGKAYLDALETLRALINGREDAKDQCHASSDGECHWKDCPQINDGEPRKSGRHCPLDHPKDEQ